MVCLKIRLCTYLSNSATCHTHVGSLRSRHLANFPGSGSKWLINVLHGSAGYYCLGCVYGEDYRYLPRTALLVKTHHQDRHKWKGAHRSATTYQSKQWTRWPEEIRTRRRDVARFIGRAVLLIRNPYDSLVSW